MPEPIACSKQESCHFPKALIWGALTRSNVPPPCTCSPCIHHYLVSLGRRKDVGWFQQGFWQAGGAGDKHPHLWERSCLCTFCKRTTSSGARNKPEASPLGYSSGVCWWDPGQARRQQNAEEDTIAPYLGPLSGSASLCAPGPYCLGYAMMKELGPILPPQAPETGEMEQAETQRDGTS